MSHLDRARDPSAPAGDPSARATEAILAAVRAQHAPVRPRSRGARGLLVAAGAALALGLAAPTFGMNLTGAVPDHERGALAAAAVTLLATLAIVGSFGPPGRTTLGPRGKLAALALLVSGWTAYLLVIASTPAPSGTIPMAALACAMRSLVSGVFAGLAAVLAFRYADPWTPARSGALIGAAAGTIGAAGVGIGCGALDLGHLLVGHGLVVPLLAMVGALSARRLLMP